MFQIIEQIPSMVWIVLGIGCFAWVTYMIYRLVRLVKLIRNYKPGDLLDLIEEKIIGKIDRIEKIVVRKKEK